MQVIHWCAVMSKHAMRFWGIADDVLKLRGKWYENVTEGNFTNNRNRKTDAKASSRTGTS